MALTAYIDATNRLLQNPVPTSNPLYTDADLTAYINEGRRQLALDTQCVRVTATGSTAASQQIYPFSTLSNFTSANFASGDIVFAVNPVNGSTITLNGVVWTFVTSGATGNQTNIGGTAPFTIAVLVNQLNASANASLSVAFYDWENSGTGGATLLITYKTAGAAGDAYTLAASVATPSGATLSGGAQSGIQSVMTINQLSLNTSGSVYKMLISRPWPWFNRYFISRGSAQGTGTPSTWSQQGLGTSGSFALGIPPSGILTISADVSALPLPLADDTTPEVIPYPFTDAVQYYACFKAYLSSQRRDDATVMFQRYEQFARRAVEETASSIFPMNYQGGRGAQILATKQQVTMVPQPQGGQR